MKILWLVVVIMMVMVVTLKMMNKMETRWREENITRYIYWFWWSC